MITIIKHYIFIVKQNTYESSHMVVFILMKLANVVLHMNSINDNIAVVDIQP